MKNLFKISLGVVAIVITSNIVVSEHNKDNNILVNKFSKNNKNNSSVEKKSDNSVNNELANKVDKLLNLMKDIFDAFSKGCGIDAMIDARIKNNDSNNWVAKYIRFRDEKQDVTQELYEFILNNIKLEIIAQLARRSIYLQIKEKDPIFKVTENLLKQLSNNIKSKQYKTCLNILNCFGDICNKAKDYIGYFLQDIKSGRVKIYKADDKDIDFVKKHKSKLEEIEKSISNLKNIEEDLKGNFSQFEELLNISKEISNINNNLLHYLNNIIDVLKEYGIESKVIVENSN